MKILTIDLDFLTEHLERTKTDFLIKEPFKFNIIYQLLNTSINKNVEKIFLINHGEVPKYINEKVTIYNFDHHHDVFYEDAVKMEVKKKIDLDLEIKNYGILESCWVYYLYKKGLLDEYYCFLNDNSELQNDILKYGFKFFFNYFNHENPYHIDLYNTKFDKIFIIESPDYTEKDKIKTVLKLIGLEENAFENIKNKN